MKDSGSTLVLSLVILFAVLTTAATFAVVSVSNFKQATSLDQSIVSYYLAEIGVERGAYYFRQFNTDPGTCGVADCALEIEAKDKAQIGLLPQDTSVQFDIYTPTGPVPDIRYLISTWQTNGFPDPRLEVSWVGWTGSTFSDPAKTTPLSNPAGSQVDLYGQGVGNQDFYRVRFKALFNDLNDLQITAWADAGGSPGTQQNIPGTFEVKAIGSHQKTRQAAAIVTSHLSPLSGLYDYALFSEEELIKSYCGDALVEGSEQCDNGLQCSNDLDCVKDADCAGIGDEKCLPRNNDGCSAACEIE